MYEFLESKDGRVGRVGTPAVRYGWGEDQNGNGLKMRYLSTVERTS